MTQPTEVINVTLQQFNWIVKDAPSYAEIIYRDFDGNPYIPEVEYDKDKIVINIRPQKMRAFEWVWKIAEKAEGVLYGLSRSYVKKVSKSK